MADRLPVARFRRDWVATLARVPADGEPLALAVSGGPDSMAMLVLAAAAWPGQVMAATFDHRLRAASADEAAMVADWCAGRGIGHAILTPPAPLGTANVQAAARAARYAALEHWAVGQGASVVATAHHADDQAETFLMRANRGSGLAGLAGIRARRPAGLPVLACDGKDATAATASVENQPSSPLVIIRPLLGWRRADLRALVEAAGAPFVTDPSNADDRFDRARMRHFLADQTLLDPAQLARAASWCGEAEADLRAIGDWLWHERQRSTASDDALIDVAGLPRTLRRTLARTAIAHVRTTGGITRPIFSDASNVEALLDALKDGRRATQAGVIATPRSTLWHFAPARPRRTG